ncbi:hypothetical protein [Novilysobacter antarcticus]|uniref:hypothetical protein n=1 Tax=Novilysobacter antarcticus TaxID=2862543 RepID=UPI001C999E7C|nr:hypothetical protein [Lysobacter antarcticus]
MSTRAMGPMAGLGWLTRAINVGRNGPGAVFGGAALMTVVVLAAAFAGVAVQLALAATMGDSLTGMMVGTAVMSVLVLVIMAMMVVGFLRLLDKVESGSGARATDVFGGFGDLATSLRTIGLMVMLVVLQYVILVAVLMAFAGGFVRWYLQVLQSSIAGGADPAVLTQLPAGMGVASVAMLVVGLVFYGVQAIALGQVVLRRRGVFSALGDGIVGAFKNLLPLLVFVIAAIVAMIVVAVAIILLAMLIGLLGKFAGAWLAAVLAIPLYIAGMLAMYVVMFGAMYHLWRDVCGGGATAGAMATEGVAA